MSVTARDISHAAARAAGASVTAADPAAELPKHFDEAVEALERLRRSALSSGGESEQGPGSRPRVLVVGETSAVVARMFARAGADVATCDVAPSEAPDIPHFVGDASLIMDLGWDLVISHPPCTYLSNSGVCHLHKDPDRWTHVLANADVFRRVWKARAPFVAVENSKMHRYARQLVGVSSTQYVHPWQHGTGHTKPTALFLRNLPPIQPTCIVDGREHALARLPPAPDRSERRSRTYIGIAAAMALQWMPLLYQHAREHATGQRRTALEMVAAASHITVARCRVLFTRGSAASPDVLIADDSGLPPTFETPLLSSESPQPATTAAKWARDDMILPYSWHRALSEVLGFYPTGHSTSVDVVNSAENVLTHTWVIDVTSFNTNSGFPDSVPLLPGNGDGHAFSWSTAAASDMEKIRETLSHSPHVINASPPIAAGVLAVTGSSVADSPTARPWLCEHPHTPPPPPAVRHVRYLHGKWRAWGAADAPPLNSAATSVKLPADELPSKDARPTYGWKALSPELTLQLTQALRPPPNVAAALEGLGQRHFSHTSGARPSSPTSILETISEAASWVAPAATPVAASIPARHSANFDGLRALWKSNAAPRREDQHLGLGADRNTPCVHDPLQLMTLDPNPVHLKMAAYRALHNRWVKESDQDAATVIAAAEHLPEVSSPPAVAIDAPLEGLIASAVYDEDDIALTPAMLNVDVQALYLQNVHLLRHSDTRKGQVMRYDVRCAVARSLADTGAGPSLATTEFLATVPAGAAKRHPNVAVRPLVDAAGRPLRTEGTVDLTFELDGTPCKHTFSVVVGKPLLLFGNDFFGPRHAVIHMNDDDAGGGRVELTSVSVHGRPILHTARVSNRPQSVAAAVVAVVTPASLETSSSDVADSLSGDTSEPLPASQLAADAVGHGAWKLEPTQHLLYSRKPIPLEPRSTTTIRLRAPRDLAAKHPTCFVEPLPVRDGLDDALMVVPMPVRISESDGGVEVRIVNLERHKKYIPACSPVAMLDSEYWVRGSVEPTSEEPDGSQPTDYYSALTDEQRELVDSVTVDPSDRLSPTQKEAVKQLISRHVTAFAIDPKNPTKTHLMEVELPLIPGAQPHRHAASRLGEAGREIVEKHIDEMESRGIIRKSNSAWGSRVVLVSKKDGSIRFCVDFRDLNSKLQTLDSPIPHTADAIDRLSSGQGPQSSLFLSTLDLAAGFWTIPIKEEDKGLTAFVTHRSKYEFNYLPFGVQSGPSYMCRLMDSALHGLAWETCMPYLDDVGVWSTGSGDTPDAREAASFDQMMLRLEAVFERLKWAGLSMKASKCTLFATSAEYLGHIIGREGLAMDPKKIATVSKIDPTSIDTVEKVRSFLGLCSYYRRFISGFSKTAACLHNLTKDGVDIAVASQTEECQDAIKALILAITSEPVLATPRFDRPFIVKTDAANTEGIGGVLSQHDDEGRERPIAYFGRKLNKHEVHYTVTEIELLAAVEAIKNWRTYLWGREFKLVIDHSALKWLHTMRDTMEGGPASRLMRWILRLQEYNFTVEHKPGLLHKDADGVSRLAAAVGDAPSDGTASTSARTAVLTARRLQAARRISADKSAITTDYLSAGAPSLETFRLEQETDPFCIALRHHVAGTCCHVASSDDLRLALWLRRQSAASYFNDADGLLRRWLVDPSTITTEPDSMQDETSVLVVPATLQSAIIAAYHDHLGHPSRNRTSKLIRSRYWWPQMQKHVEQHVAECHECTLSARPTARHRAPVGTTLGHYPFDVLYADIVDMAATHDFDATTGKGSSKLIVFADSLSRWIEAIPLHKAPTSEQVLDIFAEHILSRYGAPRRIVTDHGSNLASQLCESVFSATGVDLRPSAAEHHETVGVVERVQQTLIGMTRAANEGGRNWTDHLPFLLLSYRSTPHRVTKLSPAMMLYGRELRLPAQMVEAGSADTRQPLQALDSEDYARRLHDRMVYAWRSAREATLSEQGLTVSETELHSVKPPQYKKGDRVARRLYDNANKLEYTYAGPYRVDEVLADGRVKLTDLENGHVVDSFDVSNLRPYLTYVDAEELTADEFVVDKLLKHRSRAGRREYLVKWRGYAIRSATWEPRAELSRRCSDLITDYENALPPSQRHEAGRVTRDTTPNLPQPTRVTRDTTPNLPQPTDVPVDPASVPTHLPHSARYARGQWTYARDVTTPRGIQTRWVPANNYTTDELASSHFTNLRSAAAASVLWREPDPYVAAVVAAACLTLASKNLAPILESTTDSADSEPTPDVHAAKVWFIKDVDGTPQVLSFVRKDSRPDQPSFDTFGGTMDPEDDGQYHRCALRELREEVKLNKLWMEPMSLELASFPQGRALLTTRPSRRHRDNCTGPLHRVALWVVHLPPDLGNLYAKVTKRGEHEVAPKTLKWRSATDVLQNFRERHWPEYANALEILLSEYDR